MVYAKFTPALKNVTTNPVTQWDYGRTLRIDGLELPTAVRIDFGVSGDQTTVSRIGITKDRVTDVVMPDSLLEQSGNLVAYVYVNDTTEGKTVRTINIPVTARAKPEEYDTPESKELFAEAIEMVNDVAVRAENAATSAEAHADSAKGSLEATERIAEGFTVTAENAVKAVNDAGAAQVQAISKKGVDSVADVEAKKQESIAAVKAEGEAQLQAIADETAQIVSDREQINSNTRNKAGAIVLDAEGESIVVNDASDFPMVGLKLFGKSTQDGTPSPDAPVEIVSPSVSLVSVCRKNLCSVNNESFTQSKRYKLAMPIPAGNYFFSCTANSTDTDEEECLVGFYHGDNRVRSISVERDKRVMREIQLTDMIDAVQLYASSTHAYGINDSATFADIMIAYQECDYEPYIGQTLTNSHTLPGIPVSSGGNYTDADGQQWICDEVDMKRGVYVQRVGKSVLTGSEPFEDFVDQYNTVTLAIAHKDNTEILCSHSGLNSAVMWANTSRIKFDVGMFGASTLSEFKDVVINNFTNGTPMTIMYVMPAPIETPLTDAEITAFKALHSNKPNTTILNDAGAFMAVEYVADTKTYIDNKIKELMKGVTE